MVLYLNDLSKIELRDNKRRLKNVMWELETRQSRLDDMMDRVETLNAKMTVAEQGQAIAGENGACSSNRDCGSTQCCHVNGSPLTGLYPIMDGTTISGTCGPRPQEGQVCSLMYVSDNCGCEDGLRCWGGITGIQPISGTCRTPEYIQQQYDNNPFWFLIP
ncbi:PREDICTED: uncharacterized protein LOC109485939 [Branchiostoma belcheri]|uniref:Uncharacterized protein LOC109485939 n=1 Tax=Branchiostoma belcheri TaxID=7741 RepID=A0A6P5AT52_BRABE|nr:PREDICTED: uncharacterized protein LOC109485939 [Branchiostoma belcheri]